jgi:hypothetical protein
MILSEKSATFRDRAPGSGNGLQTTFQESRPNGNTKRVFTPERKNCSNGVHAAFTGRGLRFSQWDKRHFASAREIETMSILNTLNQRLAAIRSFMWPQYQPERYYMRGPGPACAKRNQTLH